MSDRDFSLAIQEIEGADPIRIELRGGAMPEVNAVWTSESRGASYTPLGAKEGYSTVTGITHGTTDMTLHLDGAFLRRGDIEVQGAPEIFSVDELQKLLERVQGRGRECIVAVGGFTRRGVLRSIAATPGRGYSVDFSSGQQRSDGPDLNRELVLKWEWSGTGELFVANPQSISGSGLSSQLSGANAKFGAALADAASLGPGFLDSLRGGIGRLRGGIAKLRKTLQGVGNLINAPANLVNETMAAARSLGNVVNDVQNLLSDTSDNYKALGERARGIVQSAQQATLGSDIQAGVGHLLAARRTSATAQQGLNDTSAVVAAIFDAIQSRKPKTIGVRAGQSLSEIAKAHLGSADRWPEIAVANDIVGQVVPNGTYQLEIPARVSLAAPAKDVVGNAGR